ncbi:MAG: hypothetical protein ABI120_17065 [Gemmatimonadaceae bacterium]
MTVAGDPVTVPLYFAEPAVTCAAAIVYEPGTTEMVVVAVTACEKEFGPVTVTAPFVPDGKPVTVTVNEPLVGATAVYVTVLFDVVLDVTVAGDPETVAV